MSPENPLNAERRILNNALKDSLSRRGINNPEKRSKDESTNEPTTK